MTVGFSQLHDISEGRVAKFQIPRNTRSIRMVTRVNQPGDQTEGLDSEAYDKMMKFNKPGDVIQIP